MVVIKVPATSANLGPGFDSLGVALSLYLTLEIGEEADRWSVEHTLGAAIPSDEKNLVVQTARKLVPDLQPHHLLMKSDIPAARGLGSSSAAIVAGIELADYLGSLHLSLDEKIQIAAKMEGHPDNVLPALAGDFTVGTMLEDVIIWSQLPFPETTLILTVPSRELKTTASRSILPSKFAFSEAVKGSGIANTLVAALSKGDLHTAGYLMEQDLFHEPFRKSFVPELEEVRRISQNEKAFGTYLSGAGTSIMTVAEKEKAERIKRQILQLYPDYLVLLTEVDRMGARRTGKIHR